MNKILKTTICFAILVLVAAQINAQTVFHPPITNYSPKDYGKLRTPENWDICQDKRGVIYSAVGNGILEFDGSNWSFIDVKFGTYTVSLDVDKDGVIYVGSVGDLGYLSPNELGKLEFRSLLEKIPKAYRNFSTVWNTITTEKGIVFESEEYVFIYKDDEIQVIKSESSFHTLFEINGELYAREKHIGLSKFNGKTFELLPNADTLAEIGVFGLIPVGNEFLLITRESGLWRYNETSGEISKIDSPDSDELNAATVQGSLRLTNGDIAINTIESGVFILTVQGRVKHRINKRTGIRVNDVKSVFEDREGNLWLALNNGISKVNYNSPLSYYSEETNLEGSVQAIIKFKNILFAGTSSGLYVQNQNKQDKKEFLKHPDISVQVWDFYPMGDKLLVGTSDGLFELTLENGNIQLKQRTIFNTNAIGYSEETGDIITAGAEGVFAISQNNLTFQIIDEAISGITGIVKTPNPKYADEEFWIGTIQQGIIRLQVIDWEYKIDAYYGMNDGLQDGQWVRPFIFNGVVRYGTIAGIAEFRNEYDLVENPEEIPGNVGMFAPIGIGDTILKNPVSYLIDGKDRVWICEEQQIMYFDKKNDFKLVNRPFWGINFGRVNCFYIDDTDVLWIGTADGIIRYQENNSKDYAIPFFTILRQIVLNHDSIVYNGGFNKSEFSKIVNIIDFRTNNVEFHFAAPYFEDDHKVDFSYKLEGQDDSWSKWSTSTKAAYTTLREGDYTFKVKARNIYGQESEIASYSFTILPPWYRSTWAYIIYVLAGIVIIVLAIRISLIRLKRKNERLESLVAARTVEIASKNKELQYQKDEIEHQQEEIMDSINYAKRIQEAILPIRDELKSTFPNSFILYMPKDIVSGDFYWHARIDNSQIVVCADCTGHGVPGAFMSMIGTDKLNQFVKERKNTSPSDILSDMNKGIKKSLKQSGESGSTKDGMDAAICTFDLNSNRMLYSGANRSLWLIRNNELIETRATKAAVAGHTSDDQIYELHELELQKGDRLYMSTDGYADQFGGKRGKKLKVKAMKQILLDHPNMTMEQQGDLMHQSILEWMADYEQVDDICVIGIEV